MAREGMSREEGRRVIMSKENLIAGKGRLESGWSYTVLTSREGSRLRCEEV